MVNFLFKVGTWGTSIRAKSFGGLRVWGLGFIGLIGCMGLLEFIGFIGLYRAYRACRA